MGKMPQLTAVELAKIIKKMDFKFIRQSGSHMFFRHNDGRTTVIPNHPGEKIGSGLLLKIIKKDLQITREEFEKEI
ncbi:MAG TPA: type II toxin-antitoxin system HicA family toxin [Candidatus Nanoarchaeia archaeon]|nr:type II toxin-antitoxin system HicA family toxin [Candidatus Nanoarchaeia archaeon]